MITRSTDVVLLLGAGASVEAGIPAAAKMIQLIEEALLEDSEWKPFTDLYNHVKSAIYYSAGLKGEFGGGVTFNIETLVNTLYELEKNEEHPLYPFIASWNSRFVDLATRDFCKIREFRRLILKVLQTWMCPEDTAKAEYYNGLINLQQALNYPLHIFTLNYDLCVERINRNGFSVETGFADNGPNHFWDWERFEPSDTGSALLPQIYLYKLHGSINWKRDGAKNLFSVEQIQSVDPDKMDIIFGRDFKLEAADPYLFYAYQFRRYTLESRLIVIVGFGFADDHINKILSQALNRSKNKRLLVVSNLTSDVEKDQMHSRVYNALGVPEEQIVILGDSAKDFMKRSDLPSILMEQIPQDTEVPF